MIQTKEMMQTGQRSNDTRSNEAQPTGTVYRETCLAYEESPAPGAGSTDRPMFTVNFTGSLVGTQIASVQVEGKTTVGQLKLQVMPFVCGENLFGSSD